MNTIVCPKCEFTLDARATACRHCGIRIITPPQATDYPTAATSPTGWAAATPSDYTAQTPPSNYQPHQPGPAQFSGPPPPAGAPGGYQYVPPGNEPHTTQSGPSEACCPRCSARLPAQALFCNNCQTFFGHRAKAQAHAEYVRNNTAPEEVRNAFKAKVAVTFFCLLLVGLGGLTYVSFTKTAVPLRHTPGGRAIKPWFSSWWRDTPKPTEVVQHANQVMGSLTLKDVPAMKMTAAVSMAESYGKAADYNDLANTPQLQKAGQMEMLMQAPNRIYLSFTISLKNRQVLLQRGFDGLDGWERQTISNLEGSHWVIEKDEVKPLTGPTLEELRDANGFSEVLGSKQMNNLKAELETVKVRDSLAYRLGMSNAQGGDEFRYFDMEKGYLTRADYRRPGPDGVAAFTMFFEDYRIVKGALMPYRWVNQAPDKIIVMDVLSYDLAPTVNAEIFHKPI